MPVYKLEEATTFETLPVDTIIQVEVEDIEERFVEGKNGKEGWNKLEFKFLITGLPSALQDQYGSLIGSRIWGSVSARFTVHADNKLRQWCEALLGMSVDEPGFELDTDILKTRKARAIISQYTKRDGTAAHQVAGLLSASGSDSPVVTVSPAVVPPTVEKTQEAIGVTALDFAGDDDPPF
jgi:hypothetical protein